MLLKKFSVKSITSYDLSATELVVSFQADFLGDYNAKA
jgi:molybdopterin-containing oxidoreductase family iron-sulfur binding subunit